MQGAPVVVASHKFASRVPCCQTTRKLIRVSLGRNTVVDLKVKVIINICILFTMLFCNSDAWQGM